MQQKIALSAESTVDLTEELIERFNINLVSFNVLLGEKEFKDDKNLSSEQIFDFVKKNGILPKTSAISVYDFEKHFEKLLKTHDAIIHFSLSSELSAAHNNAVTASKNFENVFVVDSRSLSTGIALLVLNTYDKLSSGKSAETLAEEARKLTNNVQASFVLNTLNYMHKGGRCSAVTLLGANLLKIKPEIRLSQGAMGVGKKFRGKDIEVFLKYTTELLAENNPDLTRAFVTYSSRPEITDEVVKLVKQAGFKNVYETQAGATICSHCGPLTLGVLFLKKDEK